MYMQTCKWTSFHIYSDSRLLFSWLPLEARARVCICAYIYDRFMYVYLRLCFPGCMCLYTCICCHLSRHLGVELFAFGVGYFFVYMYDILGEIYYYERVCPYLCLKECTFFILSKSPGCNQRLKLQSTRKLQNPHRERGTECACWIQDLIMRCIAGHFSNRLYLNESKKKIIKQKNKN